MGLLKRWLLRKAIKKKTKKSDVEKIADEVLKDALMEMKETSKASQKILQAQIMRKESQKALNDVRRLQDDDFEEEEEEEEDAEDMLLKLAEPLISKYLGNSLSNEDSIKEAIGKMEPDQINKLVEKFTK